MRHLPVMICAALLAAPLAQAKLPPPTPEEIAAQQQRRTQEEARLAKEKAELERAQDRVAERYRGAVRRPPGASSLRTSRTIRNRHPAPRPPKAAVARAPRRIRHRRSDRAGRRTSSGRAASRRVPVWQPGPPSAPYRELGLRKPIGACTPHGLPVRRSRDHPAPGTWFTKPVRNPSGMGVGARPNVCLGVARAGRVSSTRAPCGCRCSRGALLRRLPTVPGRHLAADAHGAVRLRRSGRVPRDGAKKCRVPGPRAVARSGRGVAERRVHRRAVIEAHGRRNTDFDNAPPEATVAQVVWADQRRPEAMVPDFDDADGQLAIPRIGFVHQ